MEIEKNKTLQEKKENEKLFQYLYQQNKIEHDNRLKETEINYNKRMIDLVNKSRQLELERKQKYDEQNRIHKETINQMYIDHRNNMDNLNTNFQKNMQLMNQIYYNNMIQMNINHQNNMNQLINYNN